MAGLRPPQADIGAPGPPSRARISVLLGVFVLLTLALALLDRVGLESGRTPQAIALAALALFFLVAIVSHGRRPADHYAAAHEVSSRLGGVATAGAIAGLIVLGISGSQAASGEGLMSLAPGLLLGLAVLLCIAPRLRAVGGYGASNVLAERFGPAARLVAAGAAFTASMLIYLGFLKAAQPILAIVFGVEGETGFYALAGFTAILLLPGGHRSLVWTQAIQAILFAAACLAAVGFLATPLGASEDGEIAGAVAALRSALVGPAGNGSPAGLALPILLIAAGTASLPMLLSRSHAARSPREARLSMAWAILVSVILIVAGLILAALLDSAAGVQITGILAGDLFQQATLLATLPSVASGLLLAGALSTLLAIGQAALHSAAGALSHDLWDEVIDRKGPAGRRIVVARLSVMATAVGGAWLAARIAMDPSWLLSWALAFSGAGLFAPLVLGLWWRGCTPVGAVCGMAAGLGFACVLLYLNMSGLPSLARIEGDAAIGPLAATGIGIAASFLVAVAVSASRAGPQRANQPGGGRATERQARFWERPA